MVFHLPWCAAFSITVSTHCLVRVCGAVSVFVLRPLLDVSICCMLVELCCDDAGWILFGFSPPYSSPLQVSLSACACCLSGMLEAFLGSSENVLLRR